MSGGGADPRGRLERLTERLEGCAAAGDWPGVAALAAEYAEAAAALRAGAAPLPEDAGRILVVTRELAGMAASRRDALGRSLREARRGRRAAAAYGAHTGRQALPRGHPPLRR
jgi:hypothetical protein